MNKKRVTLKQIAREAGVSATTVSLVINGRDDIKIGEDTRQRIIETAGKLGYDLKRSSNIVRDLPTVLFVGGEYESRHIGTSFFSNLSREIRKEAGRTISFIDTACDKKNLPAQIRFLMKSDPILIITPDLELYRALRDHGIDVPVIIPQGAPDDIRGDGAAAVFMVDDLQVGRKAAEELLRIGRKNCALVFPDAESRCTTERKEGFLEYFRGRGLESTLINIPLKDPVKIEESFREVELEKFDSYYCYSDAVALYLMRSLALHHISVPGDTAVIGTDNLYWGEFFYPSITTMDLGENAIARRILWEAGEIRDGRNFLGGSQRFPVDIIRRESTQL